MPFANQILGGQSTLIRPAIKSPGYTPGVTGWSINKNGSAEFNNLTVRGTFFGLQYIINNNGFFLYSGPPAAGNLIASITSTASSGFDPFNNVTKPGIVSYANSGGVNTQIGQLLAAALNFNLPGVPGYYGQLAVGVVTVGGSGLNSFTMATSDGSLSHVAGFDLLAGITPQMVMRLATAIVACDPSTGVGAASVPETWHSVTVGTGLTGTIRVRLMPFRMAMLDICVSWTNVAAQSIACGNLPSGAYYPTVFGGTGGTRQYDLGNNATPTSAVAPVRADIGPSGAITINLPATSSGATKCAGSIMYPLD